MNSANDSESRETRHGYVRVGNKNEFPEGKGRRVDVAGNPVAVFNVNGTFHALHDCCSHADAPLSRGTVKGTSVMCPRHGAHFDLRTGEVLSLQAVRNVEAFDVRVEDGEVLVNTRGRIEEPMWMTGHRLDRDETDAESTEESTGLDKRASPVSGADQDTPK